MYIGIYVIYTNPLTSFFSKNGQLADMHDVIDIQEEHRGKKDNLSECYEDSAELPDAMEEKSACDYRTRPTAPLTAGAVIAHLGSDFISASKLDLSETIQPF
jgi:hypothetical protein